MTRNLRGAYMDFQHDRPQDWDWLRAWQPNVIRLMVYGSHSDPNSVDVTRIRRVHDTCPDATILLRCWDVDDRNFEAHTAMVQDPKREAAKQLDWWTRVIDRCGDAGVPRALLMAGLNNETGPEKDAALLPYTQHALELGIARQVRLGVEVFSVGRPSLPGEAEYTMDTFSQLDDLILANRGARILHEYMQPEGMYAVWTDADGNERKDYTYLIGRHTRWNSNVPIIIGEWGIDGILYNRHPDKVYGNSGWRNFKELWPPSRYADEYVECVRQASDNVIGICPYISDWSDHKWQSFDMIDAYAELLARKDLCVKNDAPSPQPHTVHLPAIENGAQPTEPNDWFNLENWFAEPKRGTVNVELLNLRAGPGLDYPIVGGLAQGEQVIADVEVERTGHNWVRVAANGWVAQQFVDWQDAPPAQDKWTRSRDFVKRWEGGFQDLEWDAGNWTGCAVGKGIKKGTNRGVSACAYPDLDIRNITETQADELHYRDRWLASGADQLPWPLCLLVYNAAVNFQPVTAKKWLEESGGDALHFLVLYLRGYRKSSAWTQAHDAWVDRVIDVGLEAHR